jgi:ribosome-associated protein
VSEEQDQRGLLPIDERLAIPLREITLRTSRSSGPGGQHANVTASRVEAIFEAADSPTLTEEQRELLLVRAGARIVAVAQDERSQLRNRELALQRLAERIARALAVPSTRHPTRPTAASRRRRAQSKRQTSRRKLLRRRPPAEED